jgi:repressor LexA
MTRQSATRDKILQFIRRFRETHGYSPTIREVARNCSISSPSVVQHHLKALEREGAITRGKEKFRAIRVEEDVATVPLLGRIAAGHPLPVPTTETLSTAERIGVPPEIARGGRRVYALRVQGNSMVDAMIGDGDIVVMEQTGEIKNGDVVAAWLRKEQEVTLKKVYFEKNRKVRLQPCNPYMVPLYQPAENVEIQGKVIGVIRIHT